MTCEHKSIQYDCMDCVDAAVGGEVDCARCGVIGTVATFVIEEGDEWECPACYERCEAQEKAL